MRVGPLGSSRRFEAQLRWERPSNNKTGSWSLVGALRARFVQIIGVFAGEAGLLGACSHFSDTLLATDTSGAFFSQIVSNGHGAWEPVRWIRVSRAFVWRRFAPVRSIGQIHPLRVTTPLV